ncbi:4Fe-4S binding protein, partial [bacterium]|nr:4Fe-4S binding protein [bacterium]
RFLKLPQLILSKAINNNCTDCGRCSKACPMGLDVQSMVSLGELNHSECTLCGECVDSCREKVIKYSFRRINKQVK